MRLKALGERKGKAEPVAAAPHNLQYVSPAFPAQLKRLHTLHIKYWLRVQEIESNIENLYVVEGTRLDKEVDFYTEHYGIA